MEISNHNERISNVDLIAAPIKAPTKKKPMFIEERFNMADGICKWICSLIAACGGAQFEGRVNALLNMEDIFKSGKEVAVVGVSEDNVQDILNTNESSDTDVQGKDEELKVFQRHALMSDFEFSYMNVCLNAFV